MNGEALWQLSASRLAELIAGRQVSPVEVTRAVIDRIEQVDGILNAYTLVHAERAMRLARAAEREVSQGEALGLLHGVPVSVKENIWAKDDPATSGSLLLRDFVAPSDAPAVVRLRQAGAVVVGRTNMPEFAWRGSTDSPGYGACVNPWDTGRTAGGSSGGAAAAVAAGMAPLAVGTDGAGSIRVPASFCGIVGLKPTFGHVGHFPAALGNELVAHVGPMSRTVADCSLMYRAMRGYDRRDPLSVVDAAWEEPARVADLKVAWSPDLGFVPVETEVVEIVYDAVSALDELVAGIDQAQPELGDLAGVFDVLYGSAQAGAHANRTAAEHEQMDQGLVAYARDHAQLSVMDHGAAIKARQAAVATIDEFFVDYDLLVTPTVGTTAFGADLVAPQYVRGLPVGHLDWTLCYPFNYSGQPAISVPAGRTRDGLPVGLQIVGRRHADATVLAVAGALEQIRPWADRWPDIGSAGTAPHRDGDGYATSADA